MNSSPDAHMPGWQGLTIKEILEKVDLFNISTMVEDDTKEGSCEPGDVKVSSDLLKIKMRLGFRVVWAVVSGILFARFPTVESIPTV